MQEDPQHAPRLLDVLEQLPLDVVDANIWRALEAAGRPAGQSVPCSSLRQADSQSRRLADSLLTVLTLRGVPAPEGVDVAGPLPEDALETWQRTAEQQAAFLSRLPRLEALRLDEWPSEGALSTLLTRYGTATKGRLKMLTLVGQAFGAATAGVLPVACPGLTTLTVRCDAALEGDVCLPLQYIPTLTRLCLSGIGQVSTDALRSLGALTSLRYVSFLMSELSYKQLRPLSRLVSLRHCCIHLPGGASSSFIDVSALFALSHLTHLELRNVARDGAGADGADSAAAAAQIAAAVAPLACLVHLKRLAFSTDFVVNDAVFPAIKALTQLTSLQVGRLDLAHPLPGHLPALKRLLLASALRPSQLLSTLLPLLPLPSLEALIQGDEMLKGCLSVDASCGTANGDEAVAQTGALRRACGLVAGLPALRSVGMVSVGYNSAQHALSCSQVVEGLQALAGQLRSLTLIRSRRLGAE